MITKLQCVVQYYRLVRCIKNCSLCHDWNTTTFETGCLTLLSVCITEPAPYNAETYVFYWDLIFWNVCSFSCRMIFLWNYIFNVFKKFVIYFCVYTCIQMLARMRAHTHTQFLHSFVYEVRGEDNMERILNLWLSKGVKLYCINVGSVPMWIVHLTCLSFCLTFGKHSVKIEWKPVKLKSRELICGNKMPTRCNRGFYCNLIACSTCFGHHYDHHQELKSIIQWLLPVVFRAVAFQVAGLVWSWGLCKPDT